MVTWHQRNAGLLNLSHPTKWSSYNPNGHLIVMRFASYEDCIKYCEKTGDIPVKPDTIQTQ